MAILPSTNSTDRTFGKVRTGEQKIEIAEGVLAEAVHVVSKHYRVQKQEIVETLGAFLLYKGVAGGSKGEHIQALRFFGQTNLDFVDCLLAASFLPSIRSCSELSDSRTRPILG